MEQVRAIILCAGSGSRTGLGYNKLLHLFGSKTVLELTLDSVLSSGVFDSVLLAVSEKDYDAVSELVASRENVSVCLGGATRTESCKRALNELEPCDIVAIHDGARPYCPSEVFTRAVDSARTYGSGIAALPVTDTIKRADDEGVVTETLVRDGLFDIQTPQAFRYEQIKAAYEKADGVFTDDSAVYESAGFQARLIGGSRENIKITNPEDLYFKDGRGLKIGLGFDVHSLQKGRALILGGVAVPHDKGLLGHSDADVLTHAVMDGLLSAAGLPDIGVLFPDTDPAFEGANSISLLKTVVGRVREEGFSPSGISAVVIAQKPKLAPFIDSMRKVLAEAVGIQKENVNVSATTTEHLGIIGSEQGMAASSVVTLVRTKEGTN